MREEKARSYSTTEEYLVKRIADLEYQNQLMEESTEELHKAYEAMQNAGSFSILKRKIKDTLTVEDAISNILSMTKYIQSRTGKCFTDCTEVTDENFKMMKSCMNTNQQNIIQIQQLLYCMISLYSEDEDD